MKIITTGTSRIVLVYKDIAIKFPWINFFKLYRDFCRARKNGTVSKKIGRHHKNKVIAVIKYFLHLLTANRREYLYYKNNPTEESLLPVIKSFMFGYIIIQPKGEVLSAVNPRWEKCRQKLQNKGIDDFDLLEPMNFCIFKGKVTLLDYASVVTQSALNSCGFEVISE